MSLILVGLVWAAVQVISIYKPLRAASFSASQEWPWANLAVGLIVAFSGVGEVISGEAFSKQTYILLGAFVFGALALEGITIVCRKLDDISENISRLNETLSGREP